jgi:hypothetical protein
MSKPFLPCCGDQLKPSHHTGPFSPVKKPQKFEPSHTIFPGLPEIPSEAGDQKFGIVILSSWQGFAGVQVIDPPPAT